MKNCTEVPKTGVKPAGQSAETLREPKVMLPPFGWIGALTACRCPFGWFPFPLVAHPAATSIPTWVGSVPTPAILPPEHVSVAPSLLSEQVGVPWTKCGLAAMATADSAPKRATTAATSRMRVRERIRSNPFFNGLGSPGWVNVVQRDDPAPTTPVDSAVAHHLPSVVSQGRPEMKVVRVPRPTFARGVGRLPQASLTVCRRFVHPPRAGRTL